MGLGGSTPPDHVDESEGGYKLAQDLRRAAPRMRGKRIPPQFEHEMRDDGARESSGALRGDVGKHFSPRDAVPDCVSGQQSCWRVLCFRRLDSFVQIGPGRRTDVHHEELFHFQVFAGYGVRYTTTLCLFL
jgi:hypothetical protein